MKSVSEEYFNSSKKANLVKLNGDAFSGTLEEFNKIIKREKQTTWTTSRNGGYKECLEMLKKLAVKATENYDIVGLAAHGEAYPPENDQDEEEPSGYIYFNGERISKSLVFPDLKLAGKPANSQAQFYLISCYSTWAPGKSVKNTLEGVGLIPASGSVGKKAWRPVQTDGKTDIIECGEISFKTFGLRKTIGLNNAGPETYE